MVILLFVACCLLCALIGLVLAVALAAARAYRDTRNAFIDFVSPGKGPDGQATPSPLAETIDLASQQLSARLAQALFTSFNGQASGMSRGLKAIEGEIAQANLAQTGGPLAQIAGVMFQKQIKKNPMLAMALSQLGGLGGAAAGAPGGNHKTADRPRFNL